MAPRKVISVLALCLGLSQGRAVGSVARPVDELHFGVDLHGGASTLKLRARIGDNLTKITRDFLSQNGIADSSTEGRVLSMLQDAGGARCDACKTMVETLTSHLRGVSMDARPQGQDARGAARVHVGETAQSELANQVCQSAAYTDFAPKVVSFCQEQLGGRNRPVILKRWEGSGLDAKSVAPRKAKVCTELLRECPARSPPGQPTRCAACMEAFETLGFLMRRDSEQIRIQTAADPLAIAKKKKVVPDGYGSSLHVEVRLEELCGELHLHLTGSALEAVEEVCDEVSSDFNAEVKRAFMTLGRGSDFGNPVRAVCVHAAEMCTEPEFDANYPHLVNFHANVTNAANVPSRASGDSEL